MSDVRIVDFSAARQRANGEILLNLTRDLMTWREGRIDGFFVAIQDPYGPMMVRHGEIDRRLSAFVAKMLEDDAYIGTASDYLYGPLRRIVPGSSDRRAKAINALTIAMQMVSGHIDGIAIAIHSRTGGTFLFKDGKLGEDATAIGRSVTSDLNDLWHTRPQPR